MKKKVSTIILGIETSCDETAAAVVKFQRGRFLILSNVISSQIKIHKKYGGVVPEIAARNHLKNILPVINKALFLAKVKPKNIDKIGVTIGPGLITSLMVGVETAKILAWIWQKPIIPINHLKAHIYANFITAKCLPTTAGSKIKIGLGNPPTPTLSPFRGRGNKGEGAYSPNIKFPAIALVVSGGHTELILMKNKKSFKKIGQTLDDAAGEAFDKIAQLLKLGYPGGPAIAQLAKQWKFKIQNSKFKTNSKFQILNSKNNIKLPRPMIDSKDYNSSFSGLKTAVLYNFQNQPPKIKKSKKYIQQLCFESQQAIIDVLIKKTIEAAKKYKVKTVMLAGGVAANSELRKQLQLAISNLPSAARFLMPEISLCTDNAAMVAAAAFFGKSASWQKLKAVPNLEIER